MSELKLCPFRKIRTNRVGMVTPNIFYDVDDFASCLEDKCAMWRIGDGRTITQARKDLPGMIENVWIEGKGYCGLAGKP